MAPAPALSRLAPGPLFIYRIIHAATQLSQLQYPFHPGNGTSCQAWQKHRNQGLSLPSVHLSAHQHPPGMKPGRQLGAHAWSEDIRLAGKFYGGAGTSSQLGFIQWRTVTAHFCGISSASPSKSRQSHHATDQLLNCESWPWPWPGRAMSMLIGWRRQEFLPRAPVAALLGRGKDVTGSSCCCCRDTAGQ